MYQLQTDSTFRRVLEPSCKTWWDIPPPKWQQKLAHSVASDSASLPIAVHVVLCVFFQNVLAGQELKL